MCVTSFIMKRKETFKGQIKENKMKTEVEIITRKIRVKSTKDDSSNERKRNRVFQKG